MAKRPKAPTAASPRLSIPMPVRVQEDEDHRPLTVVLEGNTLDVVSIDERWEDDAEWWELEPVSKMHYRVTLEDDRRLDMFRNMETRPWYLNSALCSTPSSHGVVKSRMCQKHQI